MIETARLVLRRALPEDLDALYAIFSDDKTMRYWDRPAHLDIAQTAAFLNAMMGADPKRSYEFVLDYEGVAVGKAGVWSVPEIGYILRRDLWGCGLIVEALQAILPNAWRQFDTARFTAEIDPRNIGSARVLMKLGFHQTHLVRRNFLYGGIEWCDTAYYELPRPT